MRVLEAGGVSHGGGGGVKFVLVRLSSNGG